MFQLEPGSCVAFSLSPIFDFAFQMSALQKTFDDLMSEHDTILEIHKQVAEERDQYYSDYLNVQRTSTPRPDWSKCAGTFLAHYRNDTAMQSQ